MNFPLPLRLTPAFFTALSLPPWDSTLSIGFPPSVPLGYSPLSPSIKLPTRQRREKYRTHRRKNFLVFEQFFLTCAVRDVWLAVARIDKSYLRRTSSALILDIAPCPVPFSTTQWYLPASKRWIFENIKFSPKDGVVLLFAVTLYHVMFAFGLAAVTLHWRVKLAPSITVWSRGQLASNEGGSENKLLTWLSFHGNFDR